MPRPNTGPRLKWIDRRKSFYIIWYEQGRDKLKSTGTADRGQAEAALAEFIGQTRRLPTGLRDPGQFPIMDALDVYAELHAPDAVDPLRISYAIKALGTFWDGRMVGDITSAACGRYAKERGMAPGTIRRELATLRAALNYCVKEGYLTRAPAVTLPPKPKGKERWLTHHEAARLLNAARTVDAKARPYLPLFVLIGLYTGARKEAILSLRWSQVDLKRRLIDFAKPGEVKTKKSKAHIPIPDRLYPFLVYARQRGSDLGHVIHNSGRPVASIKRTWATTCKRAGLDDVTPHTLRHTCGTWMAQDGVDLWKIAGWLGQALATTTELYSHHHPEFMADAKRSADRRK